MAATHQVPDPQALATILTNGAEAAGLRSGLDFDVLVNGQDIIFRPKKISPVPVDFTEIDKQIDALMGSVRSHEDSVSALQGTLSGGPDLVQELQRERRLDKW